MEVKIDIPDAKLEGFTDGAKNRIQKLSEKYAVEIVDEAGRLEFSARQSDASRDITESQVINAEKNCRTIIKPRKTAKLLFRIISDFSILIFGLMFSFDRFMNENKEPNIVYIILIFIVAIVGVTTTVLKYTSED